MQAHEVERNSLARWVFVLISHTDFWRTRKVHVDDADPKMYTYDIRYDDGDFEQRVRSYYAHGICVTDVVRDRA